MRRTCATSTSISLLPAVFHRFTHFARVFFLTGGSTEDAIAAMEFSRATLVECLGEQSIEHEYELRRHTKLYAELGTDEDTVSRFRSDVSFQKRRR